MRTLVRIIWFPPDVLGVRGSSGKRSRWVRQPILFVTKSELRAIMRAGRRRFVEERGSNCFSSDLLSSIFNKYIKNKDKIVSSYCATRFECDVNPALLVGIGGEIRLALPWGNSKAEPIIFRRWNPGDASETSALGFDQPRESAPEVAPDLILTPLLGFDRSLQRLGQGAGHYDRAFTQFPDALRIGLAWSCQEVDEVPVDPWDVPLDAVLTEREWIVVASSRLEELR